LLGLVLVAVAAVVWETSERLCPDPRFHWLRYLRLHSLWHLAIGYGVFLLLQVMQAGSGASRRPSQTFGDHFGP